MTDQTKLDSVESRIAAIKDRLHNHGVGDLLILEIALKEVMTEKGY
jgi:hypothetical protein